MKSSTPIRNLTAAARAGLSGNWGQAMGLLLLFLLLLAGSTIGCTVWLFAGPLAVGLSLFFLSVCSGVPRFSQLFGGFNYFGKAFLSTFLMGLFIMLWCLLFVVPGIIKTYSYAMTFFIIAEDPSVGSVEAITRSRQLMDGNKWRLFCLYRRFTGWGILCLFTFGIGFLWLWPYMMAATAAFYDDLTRSKRTTGLKLAKYGSGL